VDRLKFLCSRRQISDLVDELESLQRGPDSLIEKRKEARLEIIRDQACALYECFSDALMCHPEHETNVRLERR
jgi:hypothetical protein